MKGIYSPPELCIIIMAHLLASIVKAKEDPCDHVDQEVGDDSEAVPH